MKADVDTVAELTIKCLKNTCPACRARCRLSLRRTVPRGRDRGGRRRRISVGRIHGESSFRTAALFRRRREGGGEEARAKWKIRAKAFYRRASPTAPTLGPSTRPSGRPPKSLNEEVLQSHVDRFNEGVRSGDFHPTLEQFAEDAELVFEGVPVGRFCGKRAIAQAYAEQPPRRRNRDPRTRESG